ncbi:cytochrome P450 CYP749A22-like [Amborella trichopoda]|nr:cytochrome P450 CYP749A22-like [Amborella trichopoda]|eukprot:XP_020530523.1 cytochrome P450 CYP749A22-like [Amborella trichopoda]
MEKQGIRGPPYKFLHGNNKEVELMMREAIAKPMDLSHDTFSKVQPYIYTWTKIYGDTFLSWVGPKPQLFIREPELIKEILNNKSWDYRKPDRNPIIEKLLGDGLASTNIQKKWAFHRKMANKAFNAECLKDMFSEMVKSTEEMLGRWRESDGREIEISSELRVLTQDIISRTAFGSNYLEGQELFNLFSKMAILVSSNVRKITFPGSGFFQSRDEVEAKILDTEIMRLMMKMIDSRKEKANNGESVGYGNDFFGMLLKSGHEIEDEAKLSLQDILDECKTFYFAGHETTFGLISWIIILLAMYPEWQDRARKEVTEVFGSSIPTMDGIGRLKIVNMIINETLRLYPSVTVLSRQLKKEVRLGKLTIPSGTEVVVPALALHYDSQQWGKDVHLFKPERFSQGITNAAKSPIAFLPFGFGPRMCVGLNFAILESKLAVSMILQRYSLLLSPSYHHAPVLMVTTRPQHGAPIIINPL